MLTFWQNKYISNICWFGNVLSTPQACWHSSRSKQESNTNWLQLLPFNRGQITVLLLAWKLNHFKFLSCNDTWSFFFFSPLWLSSLYCLLGEQLMNHRKYPFSWIYSKKLHQAIISHSWYLTVIKVAQGLKT